MTLASDLRDAVFQAAIQGKLSQQLEVDGSAEDLAVSIKREKQKEIAEKLICKDNSCKIAEFNADKIELEIPNSWTWVKLGEICEKIGAGSTPSGGAKVYVASGVKFLREQNIQNSGLDYSGLVYISEATNEAMKGSRVRAKDILMNITGASIGRSAIVPDDFDVANVNQHVLVIRLIDSRLRHYIHACFQSPFIFNQMMAKQKGDKPGLSATRVANFYIPLPPLNEQHRIV